MPDARSPVVRFTPRGRAESVPPAGLKPWPTAACVRPALVVVPAHDEAPSLPGVIADLHAWCPGVPVLVVDDGSRDGTWRAAESSGAAWLRFDARLGVGSAVAAGFRYAARHGIDRVVRVDGDGQHSARDAAAMLDALDRGDADAVLGSRHADGRRREGPLGRRLAQHLLARLLSIITGDRVSDPTCGCGAFGPRAAALLADHHPSGYPEPELRLLLRRHELRVVEFPIASRPRTAGRSTLTTARLWLAAARVALAMIVVPLRERQLAGALACDPRADYPAGRSRRADRRA
jgi:Glycosyl transferase family 2